MRRLFVSGIVTIALIASSEPAAASCARDERTTDQQVADAETVFVGTVTSISNKARTAVFRVDDIWKGGPIPNAVSVRGGPNDPNILSSVDRTFKDGVRYLVFPSGKPDSFQDNDCTPTREWTEDLRQYRPASSKEVKTVAPESRGQTPDPETQVVTNAVDDNARRVLGARRVAIPVTLLVALIALLLLVRGRRSGRSSP